VDRLQQLRRPGKRRHSATPKDFEEARQRSNASLSAEKQCKAAALAKGMANLKPELALNCP